LVWGKVRNDRAALAVTGVVATFSLYVSWAMWISAILAQQKVPRDISWIALAQRPVGLWNLVCLISQYGTWGFENGLSTSGWALWFIWVVEAATVIGVAALVGKGMLHAHAFCETCGIWCTRGAKFMLAPPPDAAQLKLQLEANNLRSLENLGPGAKGIDHLAVTLDSCEQCRQFHTMSLVHTMIRRSKTGKLHVTNHTIAKHVLVASGQAETLRQLSEKVAQAAKTNPPKANATAAGKK
jgi:hypothetical protein